MFDHNTLTFLIALRFYLDAQNPQTSFLRLTSNVSVNLRSDFFELGYLLDTDGLGFIILLLVHP